MRTIIVVPGERGVLVEEEVGYSEELMMIRSQFIRSDPPSASAP